MKTSKFIESVIKIKSMELLNMKKITDMCNEKQPRKIEMDTYQYMMGLIEGMEEGICALECLCNRKEKEMRDYERLLYLINSEIELSKAILKHMEKRKNEYVEKGNQTMAYYIDGEIDAKNQEIETLEMILTEHKEQKLWMNNY